MHSSGFFDYGARVLRRSSAKSKHENKDQCSKIDNITKQLFSSLKIVVNPNICAYHKEIKFCTNDPKQVTHLLISYPPTIVIVKILCGT